MSNKKYDLRTNIKPNPKYFDITNSPIEDQNESDVSTNTTAMTSTYSDTSINREMADQTNTEYATTPTHSERSTTLPDSEATAAQLTSAAPTLLMTNAAFPPSASYKLHHAPLPTLSDSTGADQRQLNRGNISPDPATIPTANATIYAASNTNLPPTEIATHGPADTRTRQPVITEHTADLSHAIRQLALLIQDNSNQLRNEFNKNKEELKTELKQNKNELRQNQDDLKSELKKNTCQLQSIGIQINDIGQEQLLMRQEIEQIKEKQHFQDNKIYDLENNLQKSIVNTKVEILEKQTLEIKQFEKSITDTQMTKLENFKMEQETYVSQILQSSHERICDKVIPIINDNIARLREQTKEINEMQNTLKTQEEDIDKIRHKITDKLQIQAPSNIYVTCTGNGGQTDNILPKFYGRAINPMEYLLKLKRYYERTLKSTNQDPVETLHQLIDTSLESHASRWYYLIKNDISNWEEFEQAFESKYWSRDVQRSLKHKVEAERYRSNGKLNRSEYFTERVILLRSLTPPMADDEIVQCLSEHFSELIQDARRVQNVNTIQDFESLLQREDLKDSHTKPRNNHQPNPRDSRPPYSSPNGRNNHPGRNQPHHFSPTPHPRYGNNQPERQNHYQPYRPSYYQYQQNQRPHYHPYQPPGRNSERTFQRDNRSQPRPENLNRRYPTPEQAQVCTAIVQQESNPPTIAPNSTTTNTLN